MTNSTLTRDPDGTIKLEFKIPWSDIEAAKKKSLSKLAQTTQVKGFRKGKAPPKLVEESIPPSAVLEDALKDLIPVFYQKTVSEHDLKPIILPDVHIEKGKEGEDFHLHAHICEAPPVKLNGYKEKLSQLKDTHIWTPADKSKPEETDNQKRERKLDQTLSWLLENIAVDVPQLLVENEANRMLSSLLDQLQKLGLTVDQYLASKGKSSQDLKAEFAQKSRSNLKTEFILSQIAKDENISPTSTEFDSLVSQAAPEVQKYFATPQGKRELERSLTLQKTLDFLAGII